ncbi:sensor histidine kinase [Arcobacter sp.]|uniref:sensor histidine kinase n=1 Tax=unclassified Arcobacter TaxID=2593671 RepID=UPI003B000DFA
MKNTLSIRPEARLIKTIGEDLIKDYYAAVIELVKNAYDADSKNIDIIISYEKANIFDKEEEFIKFTIKDSGEGMSLEIIEKAWMVPATSYKLNKKYSTEKKRPLQGRKGIGRYASAILGDFLRIETTDKLGETTLIEIDWSTFENTDKDNIKYLDEINIPYENEKTDLNSGTKIEIYSKVKITKENTKEIIWSLYDSKNLLKELRNLLSPLEKDKDDIFSINLMYKNLTSFGIEDLDIEIEPFPLINLYDYRIYGKISNNGKFELFYENQNYKESNEKIEIDIDFINKQNCGNIELDLRFFDLEPDAIQALINRGLKDPITGDYLGKSEARSLLKDFIGIGVYRNLFRIRPYGDADYDWLMLNQKRVNNPTFRFSTNQVVGFVNIESEDTSGLIEKSAREGLKENSSYERLKEVVAKVISEVESRRYIFRKNTKRGRKPENNVKEAIKDLFNFDSVSYKIRNYLESKGLDNKLILKVEDTIKAEEKSKQKDLQNIQDTLVMYEAHAALGRLVQLVIHEGRKPLQFIGDNLNNLKMDIDFFLKNTNNEDVKKDIYKSLSTNHENLKTISKLFASLDPLTAKRLSRKKNFNINLNIKKNLDFFKTQFEDNNIKIEINEAKKIDYFAREEDFFIIYTNLIENSIYWLKSIKKDNKKITIDCYNKDKKIFIDFKDNGPGIDEKFANEIFDAGFSRKPEGGTGIGLTLTGQAVSRNNGTIECIKSKDGAFFRIILNGEINDEQN